MKLSKRARDDLSKYTYLTANIFDDPCFRCHNSPTENLFTDDDVAEAFGSPRVAADSQRTSCGSWKIVTRFFAEGHRQRNGLGLKCHWKLFDPCEIARRSTKKKESDTNLYDNGNK